MKNKFLPKNFLGTGTKNHLALYVAMCALCGTLSACNGGTGNSVIPTSGVAPTSLTVQNTLPDHPVQELFLADLIDGKSGAYRLVKVQVYEEADYSNGKKSAANFEVSLSPNADLQEPHAALEVTSSDMSQAPDGDINSNCEMPLEISRKDGRIETDLSTKFRVYGRNNEDYISKISNSSSPKYNTLSEMLDEISRLEGSTHFYKISEDRFEVRTYGSGENSDGNKLIVNSRGVYQLVE